MSLRSCNVSSISTSSLLRFFGSRIRSLRKPSSKPLLSQRVEYFLSLPSSLMTQNSGSSEEKPSVCRDGCELRFGRAYAERPLPIWLVWHGVFFESLNINRHHKRKGCCVPYCDHVVLKILKLRDKPGG